MKLSHTIIKWGSVIGVGGMMLLSGITAHAQTLEADITGQLGAVQSKTGLGDTPLAETIGSIIRAALTLLGVILIVLIVYAGFLWMTAAGESEKIESAKKILKGAIIGMAITLSAYALTNFVVTNLVKATA
ncbi:MAG: hypothetical protein HW383_291 [Candidatus Magasanikbacteria bacterium]|nr:hypothetical protein [Candidatus Magasanikbacteria bacterium]